MKTKYDSPFLHVVSIQVFSIFVFSLIYYIMLPHFMSNIDRHTLGYIDCVSLSTTIQAGIGLTDMMPQTPSSIIITTLQQFSVIISSIYIVFTFTMN
jgi:hypothetical protein